MAATVRKLNREADPIAGGYYTVREACRLLGINSTTKVVGWLQGHKTSASGPILQRNYIPIAGVQEVSFLDLLEVRFVEHFRRQGVSLQSLRKAADTLRDVIGQPHPFATSNVRFLTDRKDVFYETAETLKDRILLNLVSKQYEMYVVMEDILARGVAFDPTTGVAREWHPKPKEYPDIALNPLIAFGQPVVLRDRVPTSAIYNTWRAENGSYPAVCDWFDIKEAVAKEAVEFELGLSS